MKTLNPKKLLGRSQDETRNGLFALLVTLVVVVSALMGVVVVNSHNSEKQTVARQSQEYEAQKNQNSQPTSQTNGSDQTQEEAPLASPDNKIPTGSVLVYFSRYTDSDTPDEEVYSVERTVYQGQDPLSVAVDELIAGPSSEEKADGFYGGIGLSGDSNCDGADYKIQTSESTVTVQFCKNVNDGSVTDSAQSQKQIRSTLSQLTGHGQVVALDKDGKCLYSQTADCN